MKRMVNMIKGINHQMIEVCDTDNRYYERAFLVLRPEYASATRDILEKEAKKLISQMDTVSVANSKKLMRKKILHAFVFSTLGAFISACVFALF